MAAFGPRFVIGHRLGRLPAWKSLTSHQASLFSPSTETIGAITPFARPSPLGIAVFGVAWKGCRPEQGQFLPHSLHGKLDHQCFAVWLASVEHGQNGDRGTGTPLFPLLCRQSDSPPVEFRGSSGFPDEMPAAAIPCVRDQSPKGEEPRAGLQRSSEPDQKGTPICSFQTWPRQPMISTIS